MGFSRNALLLTKHEQRSEMKNEKRSEMKHKKRRGEFVGFVLVVPPCN